MGRQQLGEGAYVGDAGRRGHEVGAQAAALHAHQQLAAKDHPMPMREILYPTDFSEPARYAGHYAAMIARTLDASLQILHVATEPFAPSPAARSGLPGEAGRSAAPAEGRAALQRLLEEGEFSGLNARTTVATGIIAEEILKAAQTSDLIVMGTHGRTGWPHLMLGSVTEKVIGVAPCAVLAVKHPPLRRAVPWTGEVRGRATMHRSPRLLNILIPLDGSSLSECVLRDTTALARAFEAVVTLFLVMSPSLLLNEEPLIEVRGNARVEAEQYLSATQRGLEAEGLMVEVVLRTGDAATDIIEYAEARDIDLIAMATHGRSGLRRWLLGSVANKVVRATDVPVLLSRAWSPAREAKSATEGAPARVDATRR
jgi:nucleotide-binding universal stress UspA family protein